MIDKRASRILAVLALVAAVRVIWLAIAYFESGRSTRYRLESAWIAFVVVSVLWIALSGAFRSQPAKPGPATPSRFALLPVFVAGSLALYWPAIHVGLLSDDFSFVSSDTALLLRGSGWDHYRPIPLIAWKVLFPLGGGAALHILNVTLHGINAYLVARLAARLGHRPPIASLAGIVFLTFPAAVEPVVWGSGVFDVAMSTFGLLYLHASIANRQTATQLLWLVGALLSKETAVALPLAAAMLRIGIRMPVRPLAPSVIVTAGYIAIRIAFGLALPNAGSAPLRYTIKELLCRPFASLAVPYTSSELTNHPFLLGIVSVILIVAFVWFYCARPHAGARPLALASIVTIGVLPLWQFVVVGDDLEASRYLYLPLAGWSLLLADLTNHDEAWRRRVSVGALVAVLVLQGSWFIRTHLKPWQEAAEVRDLVLRSAVQMLSESKCASAHFRNIPDSRQGVNIFRNGFSEALAGRAVARDNAPAACDFTWTADRFARTE